MNLLVKSKNNFKKWEVRSLQQYTSSIAKFKQVRKKKFYKSG